MGLKRGRPTYLGIGLSQLRGLLQLSHGFGVKSSEGPDSESGRFAQLSPQPPVRHPIRQAGSRESLKNIKNGKRQFSSVNSAHLNPIRRNAADVRGMNP